MSPELTLAFEIARTAIAASGPAVVAYVGLVLNRRLKSIDQAQWQNRKIIELRLDVYKDISPKLNDMYCFCLWIGNWKELTPTDMVRLKRQTDKTVNVYRHLFDDQLYEAYNAFIHTIFQTYNEPNQDAKIRCEIASKLGDRRALNGWQPDWEGMFALDNVAGEANIRARYHALMSTLRNSLGLKEADLR